MNDIETKKRKVEISKEEIWRNFEWIQQKGEFRSDSQVLRIFLGDDGVLIPERYYVSSGEFYPREVRERKPVHLSYRNFLDDYPEFCRYARDNGEMKQILEDALDKDVDSLSSEEISEHRETNNEEYKQAFLSNLKDEIKLDKFFDEEYILEIEYKEEEVK